MRSTLKNHRNIAVQVAVLVIAVAGPMPGQEALPVAEQILDWYVDATGGRAAYDKVDNRVVRSTIEIAKAGVKLSVTAYQAKPDKAYSLVESQMTGKIENGTDGEVVWEMSAMAGPQIKEGKEKALFLHLNTFDRLAYWRKSFKKVEASGLESVNGRSCYKVVGTPHEAPPQTLFFDQETHLLSKLTMTMEIPAGSVPMESYLDEYKAVDAILIPHKVTIKVLSQERIGTVESVEQNVQLPPGRFDLPSEIKALAKKTQ